jgi:hypothetical protein
MPIANCRECGESPKSIKSWVLGDYEWFTYCPKCREAVPIGHGMSKSGAIESWGWFHNQEINPQEISLETT